MFKKLRLSLTLLCTVLSGLVLAVMGAALLLLVETRMEKSAEEAFPGALNSLFYYLRSQPVLDNAWLSQTEANYGLLVELRDMGRPLAFSQNRGERVRLADKAREIALREYGLDGQAPPAKDAVFPETVEFMMEDSGVNYRTAVSVVPVSRGWVGLAVMQSDLPLRREQAKMRAAFGGVLGLAVLLLFLSSWFFTGWVTRPIEESHRRQTDFISAASHELRSPLAVMQASAGAMKNAPPEEAERFIKTISGECARLAVLTGELLSLAAADSRRWTMNLAETEPETMLLSLYERYEPAARQRGRRLEILLPEDPLPRLVCDPARVEQLLIILLDNAMSYTPEGGVITLRAQREKKGVTFGVADTGPGVPDEEKKRIFQRFYRADRSRSRREHYGLGLSIAAEIAGLHKGELRVTDAPGGGALFLFTLGPGKRLGAPPRDPVGLSKSPDEKIP